MQAAKAGDCKSPCLDLGAHVVTEHFVGSNPTPASILKDSNSNLSLYQELMICFKNTSIFLFEKSLVI